jgi:hypothetical protein
MKENNKLAVLTQRYGTLDLWINDEEHWNFGKDDETKWEIIATYNGESPSKSEAYRYTLDKNPVKALDELMGYIDRDTKGWYYKDLVIHWGVHTLKFYNSYNVETIEKDEFTRTFEDIKCNYDVEW